MLLLIRYFARAQYAIAVVSIVVATFLAILCAGFNWGTGFPRNEHYYEIGFFHFWWWFAAGTEALLLAGGFFNILIRIPLGAIRMGISVKEMGEAICLYHLNNRPGFHDCNRAELRQRVRRARRAVARIQRIKANRAF